MDYEDICDGQGLDPSPRNGLWNQYIFAGLFWKDTAQLLSFIHTGEMVLSLFYHSSILGLPL